MADTRRSLSALQALLADNQSGDISPQDVRDFVVSCGFPYGAYYLTSPTATAITGANAWIKAAGTTTSTNIKEFTATDNRLTYAGAAPVHIHCVSSVSFTCESNNQVVHLRVVKNGDETLTDSVASNLQRKVGTGTDVGAVAVHSDTMMSSGDYIELWVMNETSGADVTVQNLYTFAMGMLA